MDANTGKGKSNSSGEQSGQVSPADARGAFGGGIGGSLAWIILTAGAARDWAVLAAVIVAGIGLYVVCTARYRADRARYWRIAAWMAGALCAINLLVVNLRWHVWVEKLASVPRYGPFGTVPLWALNCIILGIFAGLGLMFLLRSRYGRATGGDQASEA